MKKRNKKNLFLVILFFVIMCSIGIAYSFFYYYQESDDLNVIKMGDFKFDFKEVNTAINYRTTPMSDDEARNGSYISRISDNGINVRYGGNEKIFKLDSINGYTDQDIEYKIILEHNDDVSGLIRMNDWDIVFDVVETDVNGEHYAIKGEGYTDFDGMVIYTGRIRNTDNDVKKYITIRSWVNENTVISETNPYASYASTDDLYYGYRVKVIAQLVDPINESCSVQWSTDDTTGVTYNGYRECNSYASMMGILVSNSEFVDVKSLKINYDLNASDLNFEIKNYDYNVGRLENLEYFDISNFNTSGVKKLVFTGIYKLKNIVGLNTIDTSSLNNISSSFSQIDLNTKTDIRVVKINNWNFDNISYAGNAFNYSGAYNINLPKNVHNIDNYLTMNNFYQNSNVRYVDFRGWTVKVSSVDQMFYGTRNLYEIDISNFDVSSAYSLQGVFDTTNAYYINVDGWNTSNAHYINSMFEYSYNLKTIDISSWNFSNANSCSYLFNDTRNLETIYVSNSTNISSCAGGSYSIFNNNTHLVGGNGTNMSTGFNNNLARIDTPSYPGLFTEKEKTYCNIYYSNTDVNNYDNMIECSGFTDLKDKVGTLTSAKNIKIMYKNKSETNLDASGMFSNFTNLIKVDLSNFDTSEVLDMSSLFNNCSSLTDMNLSGDFDTGKVTTMYRMFYKVPATLIDLTNFNTGNVTTMESMFEGCKYLTRIVGALNTKNVTVYSDMFYNCYALEYVDLSSFTGVADKCNSMFSGASSLKVIDLSNMDFSVVTNINSMFVYFSGHEPTLKYIYVGDGTISSSVGRATVVFSLTTDLRNFNSSKLGGIAFNTSNIGYLTLLT